MLRHRAIILVAHTHLGYSYGNTKVSKLSSLLAQILLKVLVEKRALLLLLEAASMAHFLLHLLLLVEDRVVTLSHLLHSLSLPLRLLLKMLYLLLVPFNGIIELQFSSLINIAL